MTISNKNKVIDINSKPRRLKQESMDEIYQRHKITHERIMKDVKEQMKNRRK